MSKTSASNRTGSLDPRMLVAIAAEVYGDFREGCKRFGDCGRLQLSSQDLGKGGQGANAKRLFQPFS